MEIHFYDIHALPTHVAYKRKYIGGNAKRDIELFPMEKLVEAISTYTVVSSR